MVCGEKGKTNQYNAEKNRKNDEKTTGPLANMKSKKNQRQK